VAPPRFQIVLNASPTATQTRVAERSPGFIATVSWRLLGSNHRELGRSARLFQTADDCSIAIDALRHGVRDVDADVIAHSTAGFWFWRMSLNGTAVAVSSRLYQRRRESTQSLTRTLENIGLVDREPTVLRLRSGTPHDTGRTIAAARTARIIDIRDQTTASFQSRHDMRAQELIRPAQVN
jgi:hypothetical protein